MRNLHIGRSKVNGPPGGSSRLWEDNIEKNFKETGYGIVKWTEQAFMNTVIRSIYVWKIRKMGKSDRITTRK
jgi:hypothetical protein